MNLGKKFYLKLAADAARDVGNARDKDGVLYVQKEMIGSGMALKFERSVGGVEVVPSASGNCGEVPREF